MVFTKLHNEVLNKWFTISLLLSMVGFLKEIRPSEPFIYEFLIGKWRNITDEQVNQDVYPVGTYSYLVQLVFVFLVTDFSRYKPLIALLGICGIIIWSMLLWTTSLLDLQIVEIFYGTFSACEVAYFTYIYAKVDKKYYQQVTSHTRAAILAGRATSAIMAQLLISFKIMDYRQLNYITFGAMIAATVWCLLLPPVKKSIYFHQEPSQQSSIVQQTKMAFGLMWNHFKHGYSHKYTVKWSVWWAVATAGFIQVQVYMQPLWTAIVDDPDKPIYNGAVEAVLTVLGFVGALLAGVFTVNWETKGDIALTSCSIIQGSIMIVASQTPYVVVSYVCYIVFGALYHFTITVASSEIAKHINEDSYGLIFGINTFVALSFQTILTLVAVTDGIGFALSPRKQYFVYGVFHIVLGVIYIVIGFATCIGRKRDSGEPNTVAESVTPESSRY